MSRHLKSIVKNRLNSIISRYIPNAEVSASHRRGVCYLEFTLGIDMYYGIMNSRKEGRHYNKHIIVRRAPRWGGKLHQLYTYHFPKTWSAACVANRELIKTAQRIAHALEHDYSLASLEWRLRFFRHYFRVFKGGAAPEPGMKAYSRFYQYTFVAIYRELKAAQQPSTEPSLTSVESSQFAAEQLSQFAAEQPSQFAAEQPSPSSAEQPSLTSAEPATLAKDLSFVPIDNTAVSRSFAANGIRIPFASQSCHNVRVSRSFPVFSSRYDPPNLAD